MSKVKAWFLGGAVLTSAAIAVPMFLHADGDGHGRFGRRAGVHQMFGAGAPIISIALKHRSELNLTADQVANLEKTKTHYQSQVEPIHRQLRTLEGEIANLSQESRANLVQIKVKIQEAEKLRSELRYLRIEALENGKSILNAEQREQLKKLSASRRGEHRRHRQNPGQAS
jgi:Spy/CpxP family protein refolding chaperone